MKMLTKKLNKHTKRICAHMVCAHRQKSEVKFIRNLINYITDAKGKLNHEEKFFHVPQ